MKLVDGRRIILSLLMIVLGVLPVSAGLDEDAFMEQARTPQAQWQWATKMVDGPGDVGQYTSLALDATGNPHISYYDVADTGLKYAYFDGTGWLSETVDSTGVVGEYASLAMDAAGSPHVSYYDATDGDFKYAYFSGTGWLSETVDSAGTVGEYTSLVLDTAGRPHVSYFDDTNNDLKYAYFSGTGWLSETVDSTGIVGEYTSLALDAAGRPHISYYDQSNNSLKYAWYDGSVWQFALVDGGQMWHTSLALDDAERPRISYYDLTNGDLKYAYFDGSVWQVQTVDSTGNVGRYNSLVLNLDSPFIYPHISYYDWDNGDLKHAYWDGASWQIEIVDSAGDVGQYTSLALDAVGYPYISYYDGTNQDLKYAFPCWSLVAGFDYEPIPACMGSVVTFSNTTPFTGTTAFLWDFGDGSTSALISPTHVYTMSGVYLVTLTATNVCSQDIFTDTVTVSGTPLAGFTRDAGPGCVDVGVVFTNTSVASGTLVYEWRFGDGGTSTETHPTHAYVNPGVYMITLTVTNECDNDVFTGTVTVYGTPQAGFVYTGPGPGCVDVGVVFTNTSVASGTLAYEWDFGDGNTSTATHPLHVYVDPGIYLVTLTSSNECGRDIFSSTVAVFGNPQAGFYHGPEPTCPGMELPFTNTSVASGTLTYEWDFGDGNISTETHPIHTYAAPGAYLVRLTATNECASDSYEALADVFTPLAEVDFGWVPVTPSMGTEVTFTGMATGSVPISFTWAFGDDTLGAGYRVTHVYALTGVYPVAMTVTNACGLQVIADSIAVVEPRVFQIYLPLVLRSRGPDHYEPDDTWDQASILFVAAPQERNFAPEGDVDWMYLKPQQQGAVYHIATSNLSGDADTFISLFEQGNYDNPIASNDNCDEFTLSSCIIFTVEITGRYYLKVKNLGGSWGADVGYTVEYSLAGTTR